MTTSDAPALIGYSLSFCVNDILRGQVKEGEVTRITASIRAPTRDDFENILDGYAKSYWHDNPEEGKNIARRLYDAGKIDQPRLRGEEIMHVGNGNWKMIEPGTQPSVPKQDDTYVGLYDADTVKPAVVERVREEKITATVAALTQGTQQPLRVRTLKLKTPGA